MIFAIGDSHSILYYNSHSIKHHWVGWGGMPVTMYRLVKEGIPLYNIVERFPPGEICNINIKDNDFVLFIYGFNDVQKNIGKYSNKDTYKTMIDELVDEYIKLITKYSDGTLYKIKPVVSCVYPIQLSINENIYGSDDERIIYTKYMNSKLKISCLEYGIPFFDIYDLISNNDKMNTEYIDKDNTHLDRFNSKLVSIIEDKLLYLCNNYELFKYTS